MEHTMPVTALKPFAKGILSWIPGLQSAIYDRTGGGGTACAEYCYGVWIKHLALLSRHGMRAMPRTVLELGPGSSVGTGIAALLSGAESYVGIDAKRHLHDGTNGRVFHELVRLFERRAQRPTRGWPDFDDCLDARLFPGHILTEESLGVSLAPERVARLAECMGRPDLSSEGSPIRYGTWDDPVAPGANELDLVFSHVVLCHVEDLDALYSRCARMLKPGAWMSHQTDFSSLETTPDWNGHRRYGEFAWKIIQGRRPYFVNREPLATHLELLEQHGFDVVVVHRGKRAGGIKREQLAPRWRGISDDDLGTWGAFVIARKRG